MIHSSHLFGVFDTSPQAHRHRSTGISGNDAAMAPASGGYGERVTRPEEIVPASLCAIRMTEDGVPALLELMTAYEISISVFG